MRPDYLYAAGFSTRLTFDAAGQVTSSDVTFLGVYLDIRVGGTGAAASGTVVSDGRPQGCGPFPSQQTACAVAGVWTASGAAAVPEPASLALLGAAMAVLGMARRRRAA